MDDARDGTRLAAHLARLTADGPVRGVAFHPTGSHLVALPDELRDRVVENTEGELPLDLIEERCLADAVAAFERARRDGIASCPLFLRDGRCVRLTLLDATDELGVFLGLTEPIATLDDAGRPLDPIVPRRLSCRSGATGVLAGIDDAFTRRLGWTADDVVGRSELELVEPADRDRLLRDWAHLLSHPGAEVRTRLRYRTAGGGESIPFEVTRVNRMEEADEIVSELVDITDELAAQEAVRQRERLLARITEALPSGVLQLDADGTPVFSNARWWELTCSAPGTPLDELCRRFDDCGPMREAMRRALADEVDGFVELRLPTGADVRHLEARVRPIADPHGLVVVIDDVTEAVALRLELVEAAERDVLTGALNRAGVMKRLEHLVGRHGSTPVSVLFCDVDGLKQVNDRFGHVAGDDLLRTVVAAIADELGDGSWVGRLGGDEFLVVLDGADEAEARTAAERTTRSLRAARTSCDRSVSASIGLACARSGETADDVIRRADASMYEQKVRRTRRSSGAASPARGGGPTAADAPVTTAG